MPIASDPRYSEEADSVYFLGVPIAGANPVTFEPLHDQNGDPTPYAKDSAHVFAMGLQDGYARIIAGADPATFEPIVFELIPDVAAQEGVLTIDWAIDKVHVYVDGQPLVGAIPESFEVITDPQGDDTIYAEDNINIYSGLDGGLAIASTSGAAFTAVDRTDGVDGDRYFSFGMLVLHAPPAN